MAVEQALLALVGAADTGAYEIEQSLRFNSADSAYLNRTPGSAGNRRTWTWSGWVKPGKDASAETRYFFAGNSATTDTGFTGIGFTSASNNIFVSGWATNWRITSKVFRDFSAWYHIVLVWDTTQSTANDRVRLYINGNQVTAFSTTNNPGLSADGGVNAAAVHYISTYNASANDFDGYLAEVNFIDGTALDPSSFGEFDDNGVWRPIKYAGSYTGNSFYLKFASGDGTDSSGLSNTWTANNFTTSGTGTDVMSDTPTTNWCTLNALKKGTSITSTSEGNLVWETTSAADDRSVFGTVGMSSGKWYWEVEFTSGTSGLAIGIALGSVSENTGAGSTGAWIYYATSGNKILNGTSSSYGATFTTGDIIGVAFDATAGDLTFYKNGISQGTAATGLAADTYFAVAGDNASGQTHKVTANFGQREFANPPGTIGATDYFNTVTYTGTGGTKAVSGAGFQPDLVWIKNRSRDGSSHVLVDAVRGATKALSSNLANAEVTTNGTDDFRSFDSDGFTVGDSSNYFVNSIGDTHVAWCWKAGGTAVSNTDGTLTSSVSANQDAGFSIVSYTGTGANATVGHGLGVAPKFVIVKKRSGANGWIIGHSSIGWNNYIAFDADAAGANSTIWQDTAPTSTLFSVGTNTTVNGSSATFVAYCFAEKPGISKFGEYTGNGSSDGPVISCGFRPAMVIIKWYESVNTAESWHMYDNKRGGNPNNTVLFPDAAADEESPADRYIQFTSDGFQLKSSGQAINRSGAKYIFMAWAATFTGSDDFKSLNTANLPAPDIKDGGSYFDTVTYSGATSGTAGAGTTQTVTGLGFSPDLVWIKNRSNANSHGLFDQVRGAVNALRSDLQNAEATTNSSGALSAFNSNGFTLANGSSGSDQAILTHQSGYTYVAWNWLKGATQGFDIVTGTGGTAVNHNLGVAPDFVIFKYRNAVSDWNVYHKDATSTSQRLKLNSTAAVESTSASWTINSTNFAYGGGSNTWVAYCWAEVEGCSKFGSYTGNGDSGGDGTFVYLGFRPAFFMIKGPSGFDWYLFDNQRPGYNEKTYRLFPNLASSENVDQVGCDFVSNGVKLRSGNANVSSTVYYYAAFAEHPFGGSGVSPATAR